MPTQALGKCGEVYVVSGAGCIHLIKCSNGKEWVDQSSSRSSQSYIARTHYENACKDCPSRLSPSISKGEASP